MIRELTGHKVNGCNDEIKIEVLDGPGAGGACHRYLASWPKSEKNKDHDNCFSIKFQNGPIKEVGTNGLTHEVLLAILIDRLESFQAGQYACQENADALTAIKSAQCLLKSRTEKRLARGVEGTHTV